MKKILFISNRIPNNASAGGILYDNIIKYYGIENFSIISVADKIQFSDFNRDYKNIPIKQFALRFPSDKIIFKVLSKVLSKLPFLETIYILVLKKILIKRILEFVQMQKFDAIFAPLRGEVLLVLNDILECLKLPLFAMVEDTVEREIDDPKYIYKLKKGNYYSILKKSKKLAVAGETMQEYFKTNYKIDSIILRPSYLKYSNIPSKLISKTFNIFFSGNIYAKKEMSAFLNALTLFSSKNPQLKINMYIASHRKINSKSNRVNIINLGWIKELELVKWMQECHISYLPYKSEPAFMHSMKFAFPAKAGFYITNNLPIFFHGPSYSSFNYFLNKYKVGVSCDSFEKSSISASLERFITDEKYYMLCQKECLKAFEMEYNNEIFEKRVSDFFEDESN